MSFLWPKRLFPVLPMSPCATLGALWRSMLLDTDVASAVHAVVGASRATHTEYPDDAWSSWSPASRQAVALNAMRAAGFTPDLQLWQPTEGAPVGGVPLLYLAPFTGCGRAGDVYVARDMPQEHVREHAADRGGAAGGGGA